MGVKIRVYIGWLKMAIFFFNLLLCINCNAGIISNLHLKPYNVSFSQNTFSSAMSADLMVDYKDGVFSSYENITFDRLYLGYNPNGYTFSITSPQLGCFSFNAVGDTGQFSNGVGYLRYIGATGKHHPYGCGCECDCETSCDPCGFACSDAEIAIAMFRFNNQPINTSSIIFSIATTSSVPEPSTCILMMISPFFIFWKKIVNVLFTR